MFGDDNWGRVNRGGGVYKGPKGKSGGGGGGNKGCGGKKKMFGALFGAVMILGSLGNAISQSFIG